MYRLVSLGIKDSAPLKMDLDGYKSTITAVEWNCNNSLCDALGKAYKEQFDSSGPHECFELDANSTMDHDFIDRSLDDLSGVNLHRLAGVTFSNPNLTDPDQVRID